MVKVIGASLYSSHGMCALYSRWDPWAVGSTSRYHMTLAPKRVDGSITVPLACATSRVRGRFTASEDTIVYLATFRSRWHETANLILMSLAPLKTPLFVGYPGRLNVNPWRRAGRVCVMDCWCPRLGVVTPSMKPISYLFVGD